MSYVAHVVVVFPPDPVDSAVLDVWENLVVFKAENPRRALERAIALTRAVLDDDDNCRALGYPSRPLLYGVRDLTTDDVLPRSRSAMCEDCQILTKQRSISRADFERLRSFDEIWIPYSIACAG
jgi:hypothetical protein